MAKKYVCIKAGCTFSSDSEYESDQHQKTRLGHDILVIEKDADDKYEEVDLDKDIENE